ncbi:hypothetical protein KXQ82_05740 [Mucilaginibacter sp. HMF5004]|uniref:DUF6879 family protein n=1 Tax=Mucilaginibacter rivuli TaxID=2857527 RepID=UPI001C5E3788|nr:DUF6879 family protein [Mucilaginibacter rivuli]MBW4889205.1 hypothetical protein [Mucilaginibacter rivuli]
MEFLSNDDFFAKYYEVYPTLKKQFFKLETSQSYVEYNITNWNEIPSSQMPGIIKNAQANVFKQKESYSDVIERGVQLKRVRYITFPLSKYVLRQFSSYLIAEEIGERIFILEESNKLDDLINREIFSDFLLFDDEKILVHNYVDGKLEGAYYSEDPSEIQPYLNLKQISEELSISFGEFTANFNLVFNKLI